MTSLKYFQGVVLFGQYVAWYVKVLMKKTQERVYHLLMFQHLYPIVDLQLRMMMQQMLV
jgi:hypothetical protein